MKSKHKDEGAAEAKPGAVPTVFICVRDRHGKGESCAGSGARTLLSGMQAMLKAEGIGKDELALRPCGCLGLCKQGPVLVTATGKAAEGKKPPKAKKLKGENALYCRVSAKDTRAILREALRPAMPVRKVK